MILHIQQRQNWIRSRRQRRKLAKRARLRRQVLRYITLAMLLTGGLCVFGCMRWSISNTDPQIVVQGNRVVSVSQVRDAVAKQAMQPLYKLDPQSMAQKVCDLQDVQYCFVRRYMFPHPRIVTQVLEEFPWASLSQQPGVTSLDVISENGRTIPIAAFPQIIQPRLTIYASPETTFDSTQVKKWAAWINNIQAQTGKTVSYVDMRNNEDIRVLDGDLYLKIGSADSTLNYRISRLASITPTLEEFKDRVVYIDLSLENNIPIRIGDRSMIAARTTEVSLPALPAAGIGSIGIAAGKLAGAVETKPL
jgi:cell division septal protein FtsQ